MKWATIHIQKIFHDIFKHPEPQVHLNKSLKFCFYLTENKQYLHYRVQADNDI